MGLVGKSVVLMGLVGKGLVLMWLGVSDLRRSLFSSRNGKRFKPIENDRSRTPEHSSKVLLPLSMSARHFNHKPAKDVKDLKNDEEKVLSERRTFYIRSW